MFLFLKKNAQKTKKRGRTDHGNPETLKIAKGR